MKNIVHMYYYNGALYAYTMDDSLAERFERERNMKILHRKDRKLSKEEFSKFAFENKLKMLVSSPYETTHNVIMMLTVTYEEDDLVSHAIEKIRREQYETTRRIKRFGFNEKTEKKLLDMIDIKGQESLDIDCYEVFFKLFQHTFMEMNS